MKQNVKDVVRQQRLVEIESNMNQRIEQLNEEGYTVEFGYIGKRTTYALLIRGTEEIVGYTYIQGSLENKNDLIGRSKALAQASARKDMGVSNSTENQISQ